MFRIERKKLLDILEKTVNAGHLIVIGDPGSGKTWLLNELETILYEKQIPVLLLGVNEIVANSIKDIGKHIGIKGDLFVTLNQASKGKRSILIIDALDAARSEAKQNIYRQFINLIHNKCKDWSIVASIRTYDAKHSLDLLNLFPRSTTDVPLEFRTPELQYRHFYIPLLSEAEIHEGLKQISLLKTVYENASIKQKELFKLPFNLWLLDQLVREDVLIGKLSTIQTTVQLFGLYWEYRITKKDDSEDRENILRKAAVAMVQANTLSTDKGQIYVEGLSNTYKGLMSDQLLIPVSKSEQRVAFGHNILFDYAVSRLLLKETPQEALQFLVEDPSRPVFLRPSIDYYFARLWVDDRNLFWKIYWYFLYEGKEEYLRMLPILALVKEIRILEDFEPVLEKIRDKSDTKYEIHLRILKRIFQTLKSIKEDMVPKRDEVWIDIVYQLKDLLNVEFIDEYIRLLAITVDQWDNWEDGERHKIAIVSRAILQWAWKPPEGLNQNQIQRLNEVIAVWGVPLVCKTYGENPREAREILLNILNRLGPTSTISEIYRLVHEIDKIWPYDLEFVVSIYETVFKYEETSEDKTLMGGGGVLTLTSTRKQDYSMCYYSLAKDFPKFINANPIYATGAMIKSINALVKRTEISRYSNGVEIKSLTFPFLELTAKYLPDGSCVWDQNDFNGERSKILISFDDYILEVSKDKSQKELLTNLIKQIVEINEVAVIWRHLLKTASRNPEIFSPILYPLFIAKPILTEIDTTHEIGELIKSGFEYLTTEQRKTVENAILELSRNAKDKKNKAGSERIGNRLLACVPEKYLQEESKNILTELKKKGEMSENVPPFSMGKVTSKPYTEEDRLKKEGADLNNINNKKLLDLSTPVKDFYNTYLNKIPELKECENIFPKMIELKKALENASTEYHERVRESALTHLASTCEAITRNPRIPADHKLLKFAEEIFLVAGRDIFPKYDEKYHVEFDHPSWSPAPRIEAAQGIMHLLRRKEFATEANVKLIQELSKDRVPAVRFHIVRQLLSLYNTAQKEMWKIAEDIAKTENTNGVLTALASSISGVARVETDKVLDIFELICERQSLEKRERAALVDPCISTIARLFIAYNNERANLMLKKYEEMPLTYASELRGVVLTAADHLLVGIGKEWKENPKEIRDRARKVLSRALDSSRKGFEKLQENYGDTWTEDRQKEAKDIYEIVGTVGTWLYFNADTSENLRRQDKMALNETQRKQYYFEIKPLIRQVIAVGSTRESLLHASTAHYLMELCNGVLKYDPSGVIEIAEELCKASAPYGYSLDSMAIREVVRLVETCLADYKELFQDKENLAHLSGLLNIFVEAGWPEAIQLATKLDEIWR